MELLQQRIEQWCDQLKLTQITSAWPDIASKAVDEQISLGEFLERVLASEV